MWNSEENSFFTDCDTEWEQFVQEQSNLQTYKTVISNESFDF